MNFKIVLSLTATLVTIVSPAYSQSGNTDWQGFGATDEGGQLFLDMSSPSRQGSKNIVSFRYRNLRPDGTEWTREAKTDECFSGRSWKLNGRPSGWSALVDGQWIKVTTDSDAAKNLLINVCRIAGGEKSKTVSRNTRAIPSVATTYESNLPESTQTDRDWRYVSRRTMTNGSSEETFIDTNDITRRDDGAVFLMQRRYSYPQVIEVDEGEKRYTVASDIFIANCRTNKAKLMYTLFMAEDYSSVAKYDPEFSEAKEYEIESTESLSKAKSLYCWRS